MMKKFRFTEIKLAVIYQVEKVDLAIHKLNIYMEYKAVCSGQQKLVTVLELFQYDRSDSLDVKPPLY